MTSQKILNARHTMLATLLFFYLNGLPSVSAQTIIPPSQPDKTLVLFSSSNLTRINDDLFEYTNNGGGDLIAATFALPGQGNAAHYDIGQGDIYFTLNDGVGGFIIDQISAPANYVSYTADIMIGGHPHSDPNYYVGITYNAYNTTNGTNDVFLNVYKVSDPGGVFALTDSCIGLQLSFNGNAFLEPHIDGILKDDGSGGLIYDNFVVTWGEYTPFVTASINAYYGEGLLSIINGGTCTPSHSLSQTINNTNITGILAYEPDVAGIERTVGGGIDDIALFTYGDGSNTYYQEWDMTTNTVSTASIPGPGDIVQRIDAIDYHTVNNTVNGFANYIIVANSANNIWAYSNLANENCETGTFLGNALLGASVAYGPTGEQNVYTIMSHIIDPLNVGDKFAQTIERSSGLLSNSNYLLINSGVGSPPENYAISSNKDTVNPHRVLACWNAVAGISYKVSGSPLVFKSTSVNNINNNVQLTLSPNPATDIVTLNITGTMTEGDYYKITDITGRTLQQQVIQSKNQQIDVSGLAPGLYLVNYYSNNQDLKSMKFVKN